MCLCVFVFELNASSLHDTKRLKKMQLLVVYIREPSSVVLLTCTCINHFHNSTSYYLEYIILMTLQMNGQHSIAVNIISCY